MDEDFCSSKPQVFLSSSVQEECRASDGTATYNAMRAISTINGLSCEEMPRALDTQENYGTWLTYLK